MCAQPKGPDAVCPLALNRRRAPRRQQTPLAGATSRGRRRSSMRCAAVAGRLLPLCGRVRRRPQTWLSSTNDPSRPCAACQCASQRVSPAAEPRCCSREAGQRTSRRCRGHAGMLARVWARLDAVFRSVCPPRPSPKFQYNLARKAFLRARKAFPKEHGVAIATCRFGANAINSKVLLPPRGAAGRTITQYLPPTPSPHTPALTRSHAWPMSSVTMP